ncbi:MAG: substrate-binding domain-containing protein [Methanocorpusculum sp.]
MKKLVSVMGVFLILFAVIFAAGCVTADQQEPTQLKIATTTSLYDTGLLDAVQDYYLKKFNVDLLITSQGTGKAIASAKNGDVDVLLVHSPAQEAAFIDEGYGVNHRGIAYNYFVIVGPAADPAGIAGMTPEEGVAKLKELGEAGTSGIVFVSRGDNSGTHSAEKAIWKSAGFNYTAQITGSGPWYKETGAGMGDSLTTAGQLGAYILTDEATYLAYKKNNNLPLEIIIDEGTTLLNRYTVMTISPEKFPNTNLVDATAFTNWLISADGQNFIGAFGVETYGKALFTPMSTLKDSTLPPFNIDCKTPVVAPSA